MPSLEDVIDTACKDGTMPGAVLFAQSKDGTFKYGKAFGKRSLTSDDPMKLDDILLLASATKLITSIAAVQCVERGLIGLDDDITHIYPELGALQILTGFNDDGEPILKKREKKLTLSHLLTHSSGLSYDFLNPVLARYNAGIIPPRSQLSGGTVLSRFGNPLVFEPGTKFEYSASLDFAGKLVSIIAEQPLETYFQRNIFEPLGIKDITFFPRLRADYMERKAGLSLRRRPDAPVEPTDGPEFQGEEELGGAGGYASLADYIKILTSLLRDDGKLLGKRGRELLFTGRLEPEALRSLNEIHDEPNGFFQFVIGDWTAKQKVNYALGGIVMAEGRPDLIRSEGLLSWGGMANLFWSIDTQKDLCMLWGTQVYPAGDDRVEAVIKLAEETMYERAAAAAAGAKSNEVSKM